MSLLKPSLVFLGCASFVTSHMILSENRSSLIEKLGKQKYLGMYSATAALTLFPTVALFARYRGSGPLLYKTSSLWQRGTAFGFKTAGVVALSQALITRGPIPEPSPNQDEKVKKVDVQGIYRISRHSLFLSFALLGFGNLFVAGALTDGICLHNIVIFWSTFPLLWVVGSVHQDKRLKETMPESFFEQTSIIPFQAVIEGKQSMDDVKKEFKADAARIALLAGFFWW